MLTMKSLIFVFIALVVFAQISHNMAKPYQRTSEATANVDYNRVYDREYHHNLEYSDQAGYDVYDADDFDVYEIEWVDQPYELTRETDIEIDYVREENKKKDSSQTIRYK